jgi:ABC-type transporter lipoprotein component MlaA
MSQQQAILHVILLNSFMHLKSNWWDWRREPPSLEEQRDPWEPLNRFMNETHFPSLYSSWVALDISSHFIMA